MPDSLGWRKHPVILNYTVPVLSVGVVVIIGRCLDLYFRAAPVSLSICAVTFVCFRLGLTLVTTACLYLIVIVLLSLQGRFLSSVVFSLVGVGCLAYYFAPPIFSFR